MDLNSDGAAAPAPQPEQSPRRAAKQKATPHVKLAMVSIMGDAALVEYADAGRPARVTIPADLVAADLTASPDDLANGVPYGLAWEKAAAGRATPERIADALRNAGIWTADDLRRSPRAALGALQAAYGVDLAALTKFAMEESHG